MDVIGELLSGWSSLILEVFDDGIKAYLIRMGFGLIGMSILAVHFVRYGTDDYSLLFRQVFVCTIGVVIIFLLPASWLIEVIGGGVEVCFVTVCFWSAFVLPYFLTSNLVPTSRQQSLVRKILYWIIGIGFFLHIAIWGGE